MHYTPALEDNINIRGLSMEAAVLSNMVSSIRKYFPDLLQGVNGVFTQFMNLGTTDSKYVDLSNEETKIVDKLQGVPYEELTRLTIQVPEGFRGPYLPYYRDLNAGLDFREQVTKEAMEDFYISVSSVLTNRDAKISLRDDTRIYKALKKEREDLNKQILSSFKNGSSEAQRQYTDLVEKNEDVGFVYQAAHQLEKRLAGLDLSNMQGHVQRITSALQLLIDQAEAGNAQHISPEVAKNLAIGAHEIASQVEFFSINYFRCMGLRTSIGSFTEKLNRRLF